jgi:hypothetical protein
MDCDSMATLLADYWAGTLDAAQRSAVERHLRECAGCRAASELWTELGGLAPEEPGPAVQARFDTMLNAYAQGLAQAPERGWSWLGWWPRQPAWQVAIAVLCLAGGLALGHYFATIRAQSGEIAHLREELAGTRQMVALSLMQQQSASDRLRGVSWSAQLPAPDRDVLNALLATLRSDPSVDVRLAAAEALRQYGGVPQVRLGLIDALNAHQSPLVQLELIDVLAGLREPRSVNALKRLESDGAVDSTVREHAQWAVQQF